MDDRRWYRLDLDVYIMNVLLTPTIYCHDIVIINGTKDSCSFHIITMVLGLRIPRLECPRV